MFDKVVKRDMIHSSTTKRENKMTTYTKLTAKQNMVMMDFMAVAKTNGVQILFACVPASSELFKTKKIRQIRVVTDAIAWGFDELGNKIRLTPDLRVLQG
jgi:hypothetical protein